MRSWSRVVLLLALLLLQSGAVDRAYSSPARTPNYPGVDVSNGCYMYTDGKIFCNDGGYALSNVVPQYVNQKVQIVLVVEVQGALQVCLAGSCVNASNSETITYPEFGETPYGAPDLLQVTCISGPVRWYISQVNLIPISAPATPTDTATVNPSSTATNTVVPGSTDTPIPTSTPRGQAVTFTPTVTPPPTGTATPVPGAGYRDCGDAYITVRNCDLQPDMYPGHDQAGWALAGTGAGCPDENGIYYYNQTLSGVHYGAAIVVEPCSGSLTVSATQDTMAGATGSVHVDVNAVFPAAYCFNIGLTIVDLTLSTSRFVAFGPCTGGTPPGDVAMLDVDQGDNLQVIISLQDGPTGDGSGLRPFNLLSVSLVPSQATFTPTVSATPNALTQTATDTPYPIPGASLTPYPTPTACSGGACAVEDSTQIPAAIDTVVGIDTSPLTPLELLSVGRTSCQSFGAIPLVEPRLYGTPIYGSSNPISITWTVPATGTQFQPCADPSFGSAWWDTMWNLSILVAIVCWIGWLIHWVRSLFS